MPDSKTENVNAKAAWSAADINGLIDQETVNEVACLLAGIAPDISWNLAARLFERFSEALAEVAAIRDIAPTIALAAIKRAEALLRDGGLQPIGRA